MRGGQPAVQLSTSVGPPSTAGLSPLAAQVVTSPGAGDPLLPAVREALESSLEVPLYPVRVHTDARSAAAVDSLGARAFTYGMHVFLGARERPADLEVMAHEVAHVVQQQGRPVLQMAGGASTDAFEQEAQQTAVAVQRGEQATVRGRTDSPRVQGIWPVDEVIDWAEDKVWDLLNRFAPELVPIIREGPSGVLEWIKDKIVSGFETLFDTLMAPVRAVSGAAQWLSGHFANLLTWMREAATKISQGDCKPISEAAAKIQQVVENFVTPIVDKVKHVASKIGDFFKGVWDRFGAPIWNLLRTIGGRAWEKLQQLGTWIWEKTAPVRRALSRAWKWIKDKLGIGEGPEGQNGILQWIQSKASDAWEWIKARIEPYKRQLMIVGGVIAGILVMISPAGPIVAIGAATVGIIRGVRWIRQHFGSGNGVVDQRSFLERTIIPGIMGTVNTVTSAVTRAATAISGKLNEVVTGMGNMVSSVAGSILRFAVGIIQWIADQIRALASWANEKLVGLADWVRNGLERLRVFLQPLLDVLGRIAEVVGNIMRLPFLLAGRLWHMIPACIRDPFINFFIPLILRRIPLFAELVATPEVWAQTRAEVMVIIRQIFRDFDLVGAMRGVFRLLLRALRVPVELAATVLRKAATAWDAVLEHPIAFLKNILRAMAQGFRLFFGGIVDHLLFGVSGWIFGELRDVGITPPASWTDLREVFGFVLRVLGISIQHIFELLARRLPPERVAQLRRIYNTLTGVWEWVKVALTEGPAGIWRMLMERLRALGNMVLEAAVTWIMERIVARVTARLLSMLDPTGIMAVVNALVSLYQAIQTVLRYARQILEILNTVLDTVLSIARGVLGPAAEMLVRALHNAMPVAIAFLANQAGLSGLGARMREIVGSIRERVDAALLWLIDRGMQAINAVLGALGGAANPNQPQAGEIDVDQDVNIGTEHHTLRVQIIPPRAHVLMASNGFGDFRDRVRQLETRYRTIFAANPASSHLAQLLTTEIGDILKEADTLEKQAEAVKPPSGPTPTNIDTLQRVYQNALRTGLQSLEHKIAALGEHFKFGGGQAAVVGDPIILKGVGSSPARAAIVAQVGFVIREGNDYHFGILVRAASSNVTIPRLYSEYGTTWEIPASVPPVAPAAPFYQSGNVRTIITGLPLNSATTSPSGTPSGWTGAGTKYSDRGHLVANRFYGPNNVASGNIVAMTQTANLSGMKTIENTVATRITTTGNVYRYEAEPLPTGKYPPDEVEIRITKIYPPPTDPPVTFPRVNNT